jgi:hypothetical protein
VPGRFSFRDRRLRALRRDGAGAVQGNAFEQICPQDYEI